MTTLSGQFDKFLRFFLVERVFDCMKIFSTPT